MHVNYDDLQYRGISDLKDTFNYNSIDSYYDPEPFASALERNDERYWINGDRNKEWSLIDYFNVVRQNFNELLTKKKVNERKAQLDVSIIYLNYITNETAEKYVFSDNVIIRWYKWNNYRTL